MSKLTDLRQRRHELAGEAQALNQGYPADTAMPKEDADKLDGILDAIETLDEAIDRECRVETLTDEEGGTPDPIRAAHTVDPTRQSDESRAMRAFLSGGLSALTDTQRQALNARMTPDIRAAMSTTTDSEGGFVTAPEYARSVEEAMKAYGGMREAAKVIRTATGNEMNFPTADATSEEGEIVSQNTKTKTEETQFGNVSMNVYKYSSKAIALPFELLQDSFIDIEAYIRGVLAMRLGRISNRHFTVGTGNDQPSGLVPKLTVGKTGKTGQTTSVTYDDLVDLEHSVNRAYRRAPGVGYMFADATLKEVRKIKDGNGRPIFVPGYEEGNPGGAPDRLLNRPIYLNDDVAAMGAGKKSILFGDLSKYLIRDVMDLTLFRMTDSAFTLKGQVGFVAFMRMGGNFVDAGGAVKYYQNAAR
ncbi:phage major capsid protein [Vibrio coralliilyticus]|nr:phage major capsid protein [Vibrio coralliilyticus]